MTKKLKLENGATIELKGIKGAEKLKGQPSDMLIIDDAEEAAPAPTPADRMLAVIERASTDPRCNIEKMRALLDMKMEMIREDQRLAYNTAMWEAQGEMVPIVTKSWNDSTKSFFAKLAHVDNIIRPIYFKHGFSLSFTSKKEPDGTMTMMVKVKHRAGHEDFAELNAGVDDKGPKGTPNKTQPQGVASTATILQRKLTVMVFNLAFIQEDDDGQGGKVDKKTDRFGDRAQQKDDKAPAADQPVKIEEAAEEMAARIKQADSKEMRGKILMKNVKLLAALEEAGLLATASSLRSLAEEEPVP